MATAEDILKMIKEKEVKFLDPPFYRPEGQAAARHFRSFDGGQGIPGRRHDVRRIVDRWLEGHQRVRHAADAGSGYAVVDPFFAQTRCRSSATCTSRRRRALSALSALHRQSGREIHAVGRCRRCRLFRARGGVLHLRRCALRAGMQQGYYFLDNTEGPYNSGRTYETGNLGHRPASRAAISPCRGR